MSEDDRRDLPPELREAEPARYRLLRIFGSLEPIGASVLFFYLAFFPPALGLIGTAVAYELTGSLVASVFGAAAGVCLGLMITRDFLRWRFSKATLTTILLFAGVFLAAYYL